MRPSCPACYDPAMRFGGHGVGIPTSGHRLMALPGVLHGIALFFLVVFGVAAAAFVRIVVRDWIQRRFGRAEYTNIAGFAAVIFVGILLFWIAVKIFRS